MIPLFEDDRQWKKLLTILRSWEGTPYRHLQMVKGRGADCTLFLGGVFLESGLLTDVEYEYYARDWHIHTREELVMNNLIKHLQENMRDGLNPLVFIAEEQDEDMPPPLRGDLLGFSTVVTGITNHASIYIGGGRMIHSIIGRGVSEIKVGNFWKEKLTVIFRVMKW